MLLMDISASGDFGSSSKSKRETAAELGSILAFSASRNNDKVGLVLFSDGVELYIPPRKGRSHLLRILREVLFFEPKQKGTNIEVPLDFINRVLPRRAVCFLISDFCLPGAFDKSLEVLRKKLKLTNRHHDLIALSIRDHRESSIPDVGLITVEDAESGEQIEIDTRNPKLRETFERLGRERIAALSQAFRSAGVDSLDFECGRDYLPALLSFFRTRERRRQ